MKSWSCVWGAATFRITPIFSTCLTNKICTPEKLHSTLYKGHFDFYEKIKIVPRKKLLLTAKTYGTLVAELRGPSSDHLSPVVMEAAV